MKISETWREDHLERETMKIFSIYDLPGGKDSAELLGNEVLGPAFPSEGVLRAFCRANVRFYERGGASEPCSPDEREEMLVVMQGRGRVLINRVEHPVAAGDVVVLGPGDTYQVLADEVDPPVVLTVAARIAR